MLGKGRGVSHPDSSADDQASRQEQLDTSDAELRAQTVAWLRGFACWNWRQGDEHSIDNAKRLRRAARLYTCAPTNAHRD